MKQKLKRLLRIGFTLFAIGLFLTNCEKENPLEETISIENEEPSLTLKHYSKINIEKNTKLVSRLKEFNDELVKKKLFKQSGKEVYNEEYDFTIYTESATYIEDGDYHSYTFPIVQDDDDKITNVLFELNEDNEYDAFLVNYDYSANELKYKDFKSLSMKTSIKPINLNSLFAKIKSAWVCFYTYEYQRTGSHFTNGASNLMVPDYSWVLIASDCEPVLYYDKDYIRYQQGNTATVTIGGTTYGGAGGSRTSPIPSPFDREELMKIEVVKNRLNLNRTESLWIDEWKNGQIAFKLHSFLEANIFSEETITEAKMRLHLEMVNDMEYTSYQWDYTKKGTYKNRENLKYIATVDVPFKTGTEKMYLLENGLVLYVADGPKIINKEVPNTISSTEVNTDGYHYIYSYETDLFYEYRLPQPDYPKADIDFLITGFWDGAKIVGRYATPLEEAMVLIDGKDFDGVEQNKALNAGFLIVGFIPGGKILKPISKVVKGSDVAIAGWKVIAKVGDDTVKLSFKVVNGIVEFGSRSKLATIIKTTPLEEAHHMIPWNKLGHNVIQEAAYAGFHMNSKANGKALQKFTKLTGEGIHGNHPAYDKYIQKRLDDFSNNNFDSDSAKDFLENNLIPKLDELIELAKNSDLNLNEYFKQIVNPPLGIN